MRVQQSLSIEGLCECECSKVAKFEYRRPISLENAVNEHMKNISVIIHFTKAPHQQQTASIRVIGCMSLALCNLSCATALTTVQYDTFQILQYLESN